MRALGALRVAIAQLLPEALALVAIHAAVGLRRRLPGDERAECERAGGQHRATKRGTNVRIHQRAF